MKKLLIITSLALFTFSLALAHGGQKGKQVSGQQVVTDTSQNKITF